MRTIEMLDALENMSRSECYTDEDGKFTSSGALSTHADALRVLAAKGRFRMTRNQGRMVVGYWPENDPQKPVAP